VGQRAYRRSVKRWWLAGMTTMLLLLPGCREEPPEVLVETTRELTTEDKAPRLFATSDERFRNARPSPVRGEVPEGWQPVPATQFRLLNYRFGPQGKGEVYVSMSSGGVLENVNRWLRQFGSEPVDAAGMEKMRKIPMLDGEGVWVEASGTFGGGMGRGEEAGYALAGVVVLRQGRIWTVKMIGPEAVVKQQKEALEAFTRSLQPAE
jgi:hypothetical protein